MLDFILASLHHVLVVALIAIVGFSLALVRHEMTPTDVRRVGRTDAAYGVVALLLLVVGGLRAAVAAKGWDYYQGNGWFWLKMAAFAAVGLLSVVPTLRFISWRRTLALSGATPEWADIRRVRLFIHLQAGLLVVIVAAAAAMARFQT